MPRNVRTHLPEDTALNQTLTPSHMTKQQFAKRLYRLMLAKGWSQSELGRQSGLARDAVSVYIRGKSLPTPQSLKMLASALGVTEIELLPNHAESAIDQDIPAFEMKVSPGSPNIAWLRVNRLVSVSTAVRIADILEKDRVADAEGSSVAA